MVCMVLVAMCGGLGLVVLILLLALYEERSPCRCSHKWLSMKVLGDECESYLH